MSWVKVVKINDSYPVLDPLKPLCSSKQPSFCSCCSFVSAGWFHVRGVSYTVEVAVTQLWQTQRLKVLHR